MGTLRSLHYPQLIFFFLEGGLKSYIILKEQSWQTLLIAFGSIPASRFQLRTDTPAPLHTTNHSPFSSSGISSRLFLQFEI